MAGKRNATDSLRYDATHRSTRRIWKPRVDAGGVSCYRCGALIEPGTKWDLDHRDDRGWHPSHASCNRRAGALKLAAMRRAPTGPQAWSRCWNGGSESEPCGAGICSGCRTGVWR